ncbi:MAG: hypothetical protein KDE33_03450, partial [Bacteroidetes bacterium]|nr:hypothetical protein [Bacteroidota bacterium]
GLMINFILSVYVVVLALLVTDGYMKSWAFRSDYLSNCTKINASYTLQIYYYLPNFLYTVLPPGVLSSSLVNHCHYSLYDTLSFYFLSFLSARVSAFFIFLSVGKFFKTISLGALALQAL